MKKYFRNHRKIFQKFIEVHQIQISFLEELPRSEENSVLWWKIIVIKC